ncbi:MAG: AraC family transcriptional regulator [Myxococcota bacterium]
MHDDFTVPVEYTRPIADHLRSIGVGGGDWPVNGGVSEARLADPGGVLSYAEFRQLVLEAIAAAREPALGLFVGARLVAGTHGMVGMAAVSASTARQALDVVEQFSRLRSSLITISLEPGAIEARLVFTEVLPLGDIQRPVLEAVVLSIKNILDDITMGAAEVREVCFPFEEPEYAALARDLFGCRVRYGQRWAGFSAPPEVLDLPVRLADPAAFEEAAEICRRELDRISAEESMDARVRRLLLEDQNGFPSLSVTARLLHMSPRTLHRRLVDEGTSYRALLESVRHTLAVQHVRSGRFTMEEIAYRLGYSDLANFRRAFKRWEGVPPSTFRARQHTQPASSENRRG